MSELRERQKQVAIERMKKIGIMEQPIKEFEENGKVNLSENGGLLYWLNDDEQKMADDFEKENNGLVYHVIKSRTTIGLMYALLYVSEYEEEWEMDMEDLGTGQALAYVVNKDMPDCSEFGTIGIEASIGGLIRTW
jgi:hypothetical protein